MLIKGPLFVLYNTETGIPYAFRDKYQDRNTFPVFTSRQAALPFTSMFSNLTTHKLESVVGFCRTFRWFVDHVVKSGTIEWMAIDHPGPTASNPRVLHVKLKDFFEAGKASIVVNVEEDADNAE